MTDQSDTRSIPGISPEHSTSLRKVFRQFPEIRTVVLYGSRAKGSYRRGSDIDLCIKDSNISLARLLQLEGCIDDLLLPWKIDLADYNSIENTSLRQHIDRIGIVIYP
ncbi:MAG: nucleotidyltransferase domain-containing protein [Spirochaeta sp.]